ncbi:hypothetical protein OG21DRAFT_667861 [Imleria badia]|nr:hypothetical protein OG21DRAFT_667861 [Imleria badia]
MRSSVIFLPELLWVLFVRHASEQARALITESNSVPIDSEVVEVHVTELAEAKGRERRQQGNVWEWMGNGICCNHPAVERTKLLLCVFHLDRLGVITSSGYNTSKTRTRSSKARELSPHVIQTILGAVSVAGTVSTDTPTLALNGCPLGSHLRYDRRDRRLP